MDEDTNSVHGSEQSVKSQKSAVSRRAPSQLGVKPAFSRPVTAAAEEDVPELPEDEVAPVDGAGKTEGVLITELSVDGREESQHDILEVASGDEDEEDPTSLDEGPELLSPRQREEEIRVVGEPPKPPPSNEIDIFNGEDYDTDLEFEEEDDTDDPTGRTVYKEYCEQLGVVAVSFFLRHIEDKEITMRNHGLCLNETKTIAKALKTIETVEKLDLGGNWIANEGAKYVTKMMEENESIQELGLADNHIGNFGAPHTVKLLSSMHLRKLNLSGNNFDDQVAHLFAEAIEDCKNLNYLDLSHNQFGEKAGELLGPAIGANDTLDLLDLSWNQIRRKGAVAIAKGLKENVRLKTFSIAWNGFGEEGGLALVDAFSVNSTLLEVDLSANRMGLPVATKMAKLLAINENLLAVKLSDNPITTTGCIQLMQALLNSTASVLTMLDLSRIPVEYEFLRINEDLRITKNVKVIYGSLLRSGNTRDDYGKRGIEPAMKPKQPVLILRENLVVTDMALLCDILQKKDAGDTKHVTPDLMVSALLELDSTLDNKKVHDAVNAMPKTKDQLIFYGDFVPA